MKKKKQGKENESGSVMSDYTVHGILQARIFPNPGIGPRVSFSRGSSHNPRIKPRSPALRADSLPAEPQGKPKNTGVGSLSLLQQIFPTQGSNWGSLALQVDSFFFFFLPTELSGKPRVEGALKQP